MHEKVKISRIKVDQLPEDSKRNFCIEIAGHTVKIETMYENTFRMCEKYLCDLNDKMPDIHVVITNVEKRQIIICVVRMVIWKRWLYIEKSANQ